MLGGEVAAGGDPWDFSFINQSLNQDDLMRSSVQSTAGFQPPSLSSVAVQPPATSRKSAQDFLGDNANLVNLDNLFSLPVSGWSCATYDFCYFKLNFFCCSYIQAIK
jgi:hypothetical protein